MRAPEKVAPIEAMFAAIGEGAADCILAPVENSRKNTARPASPQRQGIVTRNGGSVGTRPFERSNVLKFGKHVAGSMPVT